MHATDANSASKMKSMIGDLSAFSSYSTLSVPRFLSGKIVVPSDMVMANSASERCMDVFGEEWRGLRNSCFEFGRSDSPMPMAEETSESPICVDESTTNFLSVPTI